jgi:hypothetical protein
MADIKISQLPAATTPLTGAEIFPLVQSSVTVNASLNNISAAILNSDANFTAAGSGAVPRTIQSKLRDMVSVYDFGAVGDGVTDDSAAIQAAADALQAANGGTLVVPPGNYYLAANTVTIPKYVEIQADAAAIFIQSVAATGTALIIEGRSFTETLRRPRVHILPSIQKGAASGQPAWNVGTDTSSIGLHIKGCSDDTFFVRAVAYFYNGILMDANYASLNTLCVNNTINLGNVRNCKKGILLQNGANSNTFIQGTINVDNAWINTGTTYITLKGAESNINTFVGTNVEGFNNVNLKALEVESLSNTFISLRQEGLTAGALNFTSTSNSNFLIGGSARASSVSNGWYDTVVSDSGFGNVIQWSGIYGGKFVSIDNSSGVDRQGIGFSSGLAYPSAWISAFGAGRLWLKGTTASPLAGTRYQGSMHQETLVITSGTNWLNRQANFIIANYAAPATISVLTNVGSGSGINSSVSVMDINGNITLAHTASPAPLAGRFVLKGGVNLLLTANQPVQFMSYDGNWYQL